MYLYRAVDLTGQKIDRGEVRIVMNDATKHIPATCRSIGGI